MQVNTSLPDSQRRLLMHGHVTNQRGETSERFVDHAEFDLWRFLLTQRHDLSVSGHQPCMWVPENESRLHDKLFAHAAYHSPVMRLSHHCFDEISGITEKRVRYVPADDLDYVSQLLESHFASDQAYVVLDIEPGAAIRTTPSRNMFRGPQAATYCAA